MHEDFLCVVDIDWYTNHGLYMVHTNTHELSKQNQHNGHRGGHHRNPSILRIAQT